MGKTQKGAVWLDPEKTTPFEFFQYWRNVADADVLKCIRMLTFIPLEEIEKMDTWEGSQLNEAKEILAFELTKMIHGEEEATRALESAKALFNSGSAEEMPTTVLKEELFVDGKIDIITILQESTLVPSRSEGRRAVEQGGVLLNGEKVIDFKTTYEKDIFMGDGVVIKRGKKNFRKITV